VAGTRRRRLDRRRALLGLAYVSGVVLTGSVWTLLLIVGVPFALGLVIGLPSSLAAAFALAGRCGGDRFRAVVASRGAGRSS
jgi:hypothetical protein